MNMMFYKKVYVDPLSLESAVGDFEPRQENEYETSVYLSQVLETLSPLEREIAELIMNGENLHQISKIKNIKTNDIYKIKRQLAEKLSYLHDTDTFLDIKNVLMLYLMGRLKNLPKQIYGRWEYDNCLKEYEKPSLKRIKESLAELIVELGGGKIYKANVKKRKTVNTMSIHQLVLF